MLNVAPIANPIPSATNDTIRPTTANKPNRKFSAGKPLIQYVSAKKIKLNKICVNMYKHAYILMEFLIRKIFIYLFYYRKYNQQELIVTNVHDQCVSF